MVLVTVWRVTFANCTRGASDFRWKAPITSAATGTSARTQSFLNASSPFHRTGAVIEKNLPLEQLHFKSDMLLAGAGKRAGTFTEFNELERIPLAASIETQPPRFV